MHYITMDSSARHSFPGCIAAQSINIVINHNRFSKLYHEIEKSRHAFFTLNYCYYLGMIFISIFLKIRFKFSYNSFLGYLMRFYLSVMYTWINSIKILYDKNSRFSIKVSKNSTPLFMQIKSNFMLSKINLCMYI